MTNIGKLIWLIESRFSRTLSLDELAAQAGLSRFHISRMFPLLTGYSITAYIRGRRLTVAARSLADGAPDILAVALEAGYGSHEAFTRAFRYQFGITPEAVRKTRDLTGLNLVEPLTMHTQSLPELEEPRIEQRRAMRIVGIKETHNMGNPATIPAQWQRFTPWIGHIEGASLPDAYGIVGDVEGDETFEYIVGVEVPSDADIPGELQAFDVPPLRQAVFRHNGHITEIQGTMRAIFGVWLPRLGLEAGGEYGVIEHYGPDFDPQTGNGTVGVWIGLKD